MECNKLLILAQSLLHYKLELQGMLLDFKNFGEDVNPKMVSSAGLPL